MNFLCAIFALFRCDVRLMTNANLPCDLTLFPSSKWLMTTRKIAWWLLCHIFGCDPFLISILFLPNKDISHYDNRKGNIVSDHLSNYTILCVSANPNIQISPHLSWTLEMHGHSIPWKIWRQCWSNNKTRETRYAASVSLLSYLCKRNNLRDS